VVGYYLGVMPASQAAKAEYEIHRLAQRGWCSHTIADQIREMHGHQWCWCCENPLAVCRCITEIPERASAIRSRFDPRLHT
jgi:hypothetical protein